jgi:hypothetical protein
MDSVSCECCVLPSSDLCDGMIPRPGESYRLCHCVVRCNNNHLHLRPVGKRGRTKKYSRDMGPKTAVWYANASSTYMMIIARQR